MTGNALSPAAGPLPQVEGGSGPLTTDVVVVGAGIVGASAGYHLAARGAEVVIVDRGEFGREASGRNAGTMHTQMYGGYFSSWFEQEGGPSSEQREMLGDITGLFAASAARWKRLEAELGEDCGVRMKGGLMVAETEDQLRMLERKSEAESAMGVVTEVLSTADIQRLEPNISGRVIGATYNREEGFVNPLLATGAFLRSATRRGARLLLHSGVSGIERETRGGFTVQAGSWRIKASRIVVAAGPWSNDVLGLIGANLPTLDAHPLQVIVSEPWKPTLKMLVWHARRRLTLRQTQYSTFLIGGGWRGFDMGGDRISPSMAHIAGNLTVATDVVPEIANARLLRAWGGITNSVGHSTPNRVGIVGPFEREPGLYACVSSGLGVTLSPVLGAMLAEVLLGGEATLPSAWFSPERASRPG